MARRMERARARSEMHDKVHAKEKVLGDPTLLGGGRLHTAQRGARQEEGPGRLPRRARVDPTVRGARPRDAPTHARRRREPRPEIPHPHLRPPRAWLRPAPPLLAPLGGRCRGVLPDVAARRRRLARLVSALACLTDAAAAGVELLRR